MKIYLHDYQQIVKSSEILAFYLYITKQEIVFLTYF